MRLARLVMLILAVVLPAAPLATAGEGVTTRIDLETGIGETVLQSGLKVLTLERRGAPVVSCQIWYRVGSADESTGATGLAHFLEHMMFKGTQRYQRGEIDRLTLELGGGNNAGTSRDYTYYYFSFASDRWETALEIEADRMRNLRLDLADFRAEKKVVIEELRMGRDGPWGEMDETVEATSYLTHPYRNPIIGWETDVEALTLARMKAFYDLHYRPRNATLVIVGDFDTRRTLSRVTELFGGIPAGPERMLRRPTEPAQNGERRIVVRREAEVGRLEILYHSVTVADPDAPVLTVIGQLLSGGKASRLDRRLLEDEQIATAVNAWSDCRSDPGLFWIWSEAGLGVTPERVLEPILEEVERLKTEDVGEKELQRAKTTIIAELVFGRATAEQCAERIGRFATTSDWRLLGTTGDRIRAVTASDIRRAAKRYLSSANRTVALSPAGSGGGGGEKRGTGGRSVRRRSRETPAPAGKGVQVHLSPTVRRLDSGLTLLLMRHTAIPVTAIRARVDAGVLREDKPGLAHLTGAGLLEGAAGRDGIAFAEELERIGASMTASATGLTARSLSRETETLVGLLADALLRPEFPEKAIKKLRTRILSEIRSARDDPKSLASEEFRRLVYGAHPLARPVRGTEKGVAALTKKDVLRHYRDRYVPANTVIGVVSDLPVDSVTAIFEAAFGKWKGEGAKSPVLPPVPEPSEQHLRILRDTDQTNVYIGHRGVRRNHPDYYSLLVMDYVLGLGPGFTDRLSRTIRDRDGLAYDVHATITSEAGVEPGTFYAYVGTTAAQEEKAVGAIVREIRSIREKHVSAEELAGAKAYLTGSFAFRYETAEQIASALVGIHRYGLGFDYPEKFAERVGAVTAAEVLRVAKKHLAPDRLITVSVGPGSPKDQR